MNSIRLSAEAVPVTMTTTGYILDKAPDGSTVVYSITPDISASLQRVSITGGSPPFSASFAATALNKQIITYTPSVPGSPYFNSFDTLTGTWSGPGLLNNGNGTNPTSTPTPGPKAPIGAIIGGAVGGVIVIALLVFLFVRHRRRDQQKAVEGSAIVVQHMDLTDKSNGNQSGQVPQMQQVQYYQPYEQHHDTSYVHPPPPPPVNPNAATSFEAYRPMSMEEATEYSSPYVSPSSYRDSIATSVATPNLEHTYAKPQLSSYGGTVPQSPQLYHQQEAANPRSPQSTPSASLAPTETR
ncbi:hypothetical protein BGX29_000176 [Mortierella sp. GBA35]|nr:hypothetical protein BGX29_000176 [Mortierella sp. GBA35]